MKKREEIQIRDPYVLRINEDYYLYGSTDTNIWGTDPSAGFDAYRSKDLENWEGPFKVFVPSPDFWGKDNFWAPEVHVYQEKYYMFATFRGENRMRGTAILKADHPLGPFREWSQGAVTPKEWMALDGTLYVEDGVPWIVFCHEWVQIGDGTVCAMRLSDDLKETIGEPIQLFASTEAKWSKTAESKSNQIIGYVTDGCFLHRLKNGKLIMLWSCIGEEGYCIGYASSISGKLAGSWTQREIPLFEKDGGHGMIFQADQEQLYLAIHTPNQSPCERAVFISLQETEDGFILTETI